MSRVNLETYSGVGVMSGTSHDGLDLAYCTFIHYQERWEYRIAHAVTIPYPENWKERLLGLPGKDKAVIRETDMELGQYIGFRVLEFIQNNSLRPQFIASHGHTVFHEPEKGITLQIGDGGRIAKISGAKVICDFRSKDVAMGGQGAPLVPLGDRMLFPGYDYCLNIGGIANISNESEGDRVAFDVCPANMVLNILAARAGLAYDDRGMIAARGVVVRPLLDKLEQLPFYLLEGPRSLGREWVLANVIPLLESYAEHPLSDLLASVTEHIAMRIAAATGTNRQKRMLVTGGGAYNDFLMKRIIEKSEIKVIIPDPILIEFKEALVFAFLGLLRLRGEVNVLGSVTGSGRDHCAGEIFHP